MSGKQRNVMLLVIIVMILAGGAVFLRWQDSKRVSNYHRPSIKNLTQFPQTYVDNNREKIIVEIPEVYELLNVVIAISDRAQEGTINVNRHNKQYYPKVIDRFSQYKDHSAVTKIQETMQKRGYSYVRKLFAYNFENGVIKHGGIYNEDEVKQLGEEHAELLADFAEKSDFRRFYKENRNYYQQQIEIFKEMVPLKEIWSWLETNFPQRHDCYRVVLSPLVYGSHNTLNFADESKDYSEILMFVSTAQHINSFDKVSEPFRKSLVTRMVFTEIDHNYVNPVTNEDKNIARVAEAFSNLDKWNTKNNYRSPALTFNEYMTWSVACLYVFDNYQTENYNKFLESTIQTMNYRGFVLFDKFYDRLLELYMKREYGETIYDLYPEILKWAKDM